jgi:hypothetical protein
VNESTIRAIRIVVSIFFGLIQTGIGVTRYGAENPTADTWTLVGLWAIGLPVTTAINHFMMKTWMDWRNRH